MEHIAALQASSRDTRYLTYPLAALCKIHPQTHNIRSIDYTLDPFYFSSLQYLEHASHSRNISSNRSLKHPSSFKKPANQFQRSNKVYIGMYIYITI